jgi:hypothetical protein
MNLLCPSCQRQLQVPEQYAGQLMQCPLCSAQFTVPVLPTMPPPSPPAPPSGPLAQQQQYQAPPPPLPDAEVPMTGMVGRGIAISPRVVPWIVPLSLLAIFILMFFPWIGMYYRGTGVATQNGWQAAFGSVSMDERWKGYATNEQYWKDIYGPKENIEGLRDPGISVLLIFFVLVLIPAIGASMLSVLLSSGLLPVQVPPFLAPFWPMRSLFVGGLAAATLIFLLLVFWIGFSLEQKAARQVDDAVKVLQQAPDTKTAEKNDPLRWDVETGVRLGGHALRSTAWLTLVLLFNILAVAGSVMELVLERRGPQALPRIVIGNG